MTAPTTSSTSRRGSLAFWVIFTLFAAYAVCFIFRTSFVVAGERYFSLFDDAMVSMRYARNLARGDGLYAIGNGVQASGGGYYLDSGKLHQGFYDEWDFHHFMSQALASLLLFHVLDDEPNRRRHIAWGVG